MVGNRLPGWENPDPAGIEAIIRGTKVIAVVGLSDDPGRPSFRVASFLIQQGFDIIPINPGQKEILGKTCHPDLKSVGRPIDLIDVFRRGEATPPIVADALALGVKYIWLQEGVISEESYRLATQAGRPIVMDRCLLKEISRLGR